MTGLSIQNLSASIGGKALFKAVNVTAQGGQIVAITGPNGAGKSSLLRALAGLLEIDAGTALLDEVAIESLSVAERADNISYLPQLGPVHWPMTVEAIIALGQSVVKNQEIEAMMRALDIASLKGRGMGHLSGGERARVLLARALITPKSLLLLDEPTAALDPAHQLLVMNDLRQRVKAHKSIALVVMHDFQLIRQYADHLLLMDQGQAVTQGAPDDVLSIENLAKVYGIRQEDAGYKLI